MHGNLTLPAFGLLLFSITLGSFGQICLKLGLAGEKIAIVYSPIQTMLNVLAFMVRPYVLLGLSLYVVSTFSWLLVLSRVRLSVAYPMISMSYILVVILSAAILREHVDWRFAIAGLAFICAGVTFIGLGLGQIGGR